MEKHIKKSKRGLTFSFRETEHLRIGSRYDYLITKQGIRIVASEKGRYKVSRKRNGSSWSPLIDLRNKEVLDTIAKLGDIRLSIMDEAILVSKADAKSIVLQFAIPSLTHVRKVVGLSDAQALSSVLEGAQISLDEYLASSRSPLDVAQIYQDLPDVYTVVSLFSGAGILDWPFFKDERFNIQYAIDYDAGACETYRENIGDHIVCGDVHKAFTPDGFPQDKAVAGSPDVIIGGPSCKPFSNANRHTRLEDHPDSDLLMQYMRIVEKLNPKVFAIENVPEVLTACDGSYYAAVQEKAESFGYELVPSIVQDWKVGGYTTRKRAVIVGSRIGKPSLSSIGLVHGMHNAGDALGKVDPTWANYGDISTSSEMTRKRMSFVPQGGNYTSIPEEYRTESKNRHSCTYRRLAWNEPAPTITNWRKPPLIHPLEDRTLTVAEAKALQGLPKDFRVCGTLGQKQQQIGNCVPVAIGRYIKSCLLRMLEGGLKAQFA
jgi:DNA (cytosine-5)-methyltransferase 1